MNVNSTTWRISRTGINGSTPAVSGSVTNAVDICTSTTLPSICSWSVSIGNKGQTITDTTPSFRDTSKFHTSIDGILYNDSNVPSIVSKIIHDKFSVSSRRNLNLRSRMDVAAETIQPMGPQLILHGIPTIDKFNEKDGI